MKRYSNHTTAHWSSRSSPTVEEDWEENSWGKATKSSMKHQPEHGRLQRPDRAVTPGATTTIYRIGRKLG